jgi:NTE family protein
MGKPDWPASCYLALEGGGVKGAALVGGLKKLEEKGVNILAYGGVSAGSIVAAMHAVGYSAEEIRQELLKKNFVQFLDGFTPGFDLKNVLYGLPEVRGGIRGLIKLHRHAKRNGLYDAARKISTEKGLYDGDDFKGWIKGLIDARGPKDTRGRVTFGTLKRAGKDIRILAANLGTRRYERFDATTYADMELCLAVRASMAIPFFFKPVPFGSDTFFVDGGIVSNFPAWLFAKEAHANGSEIIGLKLEGETYRRIDSFGAFCSAIYNTIFEGANEIQNLDIRNLHPVSIDTKSYSTLDFAITDKDKETLFMLGYYSVSTYFAP